MLKRFRKTLVTAAAMIALLALPMALAMPASVSAQGAGGATGEITTGDNPIQDNLKCGTKLSTSGSADCDVSGGTDKVNSLITTIVNIFSIIVGIVSVIMIIYGGFRYVTSGGDSGNVSNAKNTIIYAIIGLVVVALAQFIVQFVLDKVTATT
jgi:hypothetical protein